MNTAFRECSTSPVISHNGKMVRIFIKDDGTTPAIGEVRCVQGHLFEVLSVHPSADPAGDRRLGVFAGKALAADLVGTGYDGARYSY